MVSVRSCKCTSGNEGRAGKCEYARSLTGALLFINACLLSTDINSLQTGDLAGF